MSVYNEFLNFVYEMRQLKSKTELFKNPLLHKTYLIYNKALCIDSRFKLKTILRQYRQVRFNALAFKADDLKYNLQRSGFFTRDDCKKSSRSLVAMVTDALQKNEALLYNLDVYYGKVDIYYNEQSTRKIVNILINPADLESLTNLPPNIYVNIDGTAYNKNGFDFIYDYFNQSESFSEMFNKYVNDDLMELNIYRA